ncbi:MULTISPECIES: hypothetical protein [unclassified Streptomyces]|uniref:hypothetical protein n=1 Tax=unclassified Streptomyces TaxID=2593676 RepID=UPI00382BE599
MTITYYAPRPRRTDPRATPAPSQRVLGVALPSGFIRARDSAPALAHGSGGPSAPGRDEREARARMIAALQGGGSDG